MAAIRDIVRLARSIRERLRIKHRHPLPALYVSGIEPSVLAAHGDLLRQEVNVKRVEILSDPDRYVARAVRLDTSTLGRHLKGRLKAVQAAIAAGDYAIHPDGSLRAVDVVVQAGEYSYQMNVVDKDTPAAAERDLVVVLDTTRDENLRLEADARDLNRIVLDLRKRAGLGYSDAVVLSISGPGVEGLLSAFGSWLMEQTLAVTMVTTPLEEPLATGSVKLGSADAHVAIGLPAAAARAST
jgi:isoleucyl-tRNA synthetase